MNNTVKAIKPEIIDFPRQGLTDRQIDNRIKKLSDLEADYKRIKAEIDAIKAEIKEVMRSDEIQTSNWIIRNTPFTRTTIDSKRLKDEFPEVYQEYSKVTEQTKFSYKAI